MDKKCQSKLWGTLCNEAIEIRSLLNDKLEEALDILNDSFFINESICIGSEINLKENVKARNELRKMCQIIAQDCVSLVAIEKSTKSVVAVAFTKLQFPPTAKESPFFIKFRDEHVTTPQAKALIDFMVEVDDENDVFSSFNLSCVCELTFLATLPNWERRGIGTSLTKYTIELAQALKQGVGVEYLPASLQTKRPQAVTALFTSRFSQKIGKKLHFQIINCAPFSKFHFNGKAFSERIDPQNSICQHVIYLIT